MLIDIHRYCSFMYYAFSFQSLKLPNFIDDVLSPWRGREYCDCLLDFDTGWPEVENSDNIVGQTWLQKAVCSSQRLNFLFHHIPLDEVKPRFHPSIYPWEHSSILTDCFFITLTNSTFTTICHIFNFFFAFKLAIIPSSPISCILKDWNLRLLWLQDLPWKGKDLRPHWQQVSIIYAMHCRMGHRGW